MGNERQTRNTRIVVDLPIAEKILIKKLVILFDYSHLTRKMQSLFKIVNILRFLSLIHLSSSMITGSGASPIREKQRIVSSMTFSIPATRTGPNYAESVWRQRQVSYFAYGSNMNPAVLKDMRGIIPLGEEPGLIRGYRLAFNLIGLPLIAPSSASAEPSPGDELHGVLFTLSRSD
jgi:hypothetical protein